MKYESWEEIHARAVGVAARFRRTEAELLDVLALVDAKGVYVRRGHSRLFHYVTSELGLSEGTAHDLIRVMRKAREVPALKAELQPGKLTLSKARRVAAVLTPANQDEWLEKART